MPLADRIVESVGSIGSDVCGTDMVAERLIEAERFSFDIEAKSAIVQIAESRALALVKAIPLCRLPFEKCWLEWPGDAAGARRDDSGDDTEEPRSFGVLLEAQDDSLQRFSISFVWDFKPNGKASYLHDIAGNSINISCVAFWVDWTKEIGQHATTDAEASKALEASLLPFVPPQSRGLLTHLRSNGLTGDVERLLAANVDDVRGEICYVIAALCLLNTKNYVSVDPVDLVKQNKARMRRRKAPLLSYSTVRIRLSKQERAAAKAFGMTREEMRKHVVRGHFKVRRSGIYWWRPYIRGSAAVGEVKRSEYKVAA